MAQPDSLKRDALTAALEKATSPQKPKIPRAVDQLREKMGDKPITAQALKEVFSAKDYNNFCNNFRASLTEKQKDEYK